MTEHEQWLNLVITLTVGLNNTVILSLNGW